MRQPNHIILDFENNKSLNSSNYWALQYLTSEKSLNTDLLQLDIHKKYQQKSYAYLNTPLLKSQQKFTIKSDTLHDADLLRSWEKDGLTKMFKPTATQTTKTSKYLLRYSQHKGRDAYMYINSTNDQYNMHKLKYLMSRYSQGNYKTTNTSLVTWFNTVNVNFLRKERLYTKLKYSRSPAFDIVSGGAAALLAAFFGFLISEKFGYELVDSGDFYFLFMYIVFIVFSIRPLLTVSDSSKGFWNTFSLKRVSLFYINLLQLCLKKFK